MLTTLVQNIIGKGRPYISWATHFIAPIMQQMYMYVGYLAFLSFFSDIVLYYGSFLPGFDPYHFTGPFLHEMNFSGRFFVLAIYLEIVVF